MRAAAIAFIVALPACGRIGFGTDDDAPAATGDASVVRDAPTPMPCTATGLTCEGASAGIRACDGTCLAFCNQGVTPTVAAARCAAWSGALVSVGSASELACLTALPTNDAWLGLEQAPGSTQLDAGWTWADGTPGSGLPWKTGEPDDNGGIEDGEEQCSLLAGGGVFLDVSCANTKPFLCERPAAP